LQTNGINYNMSELLVCLCFAIS